MRLLNIPTMSSQTNLGLRIVLIIFLSTFLSKLPTGQMPSLLDVYTAILSGAIAAVVMLESETDVQTSAATSQLTNVETLPVVVCPKCGGLVPAGNYCSKCDLSFTQAVTK